MPNNRTAIPDGSDINTYTTPGVYAVASDSSASTMTNMPRNASGKLIVIVRGNNLVYLQQKYITTSSAYVEYVRNCNNGTWTAWEQLPTRAEVDALNSRLTSLASTHVSFQRDNTNSRTFSFDVSPLQTNSFRAAIVIHHDKDHPSVHLLSLGIGTEVTASVGKIYGDSSSLTISSANINNSTITISFGAIAYGGCSLFWLG